MLKGEVIDLTGDDDDADMDEEHPLSEAEERPADSSFKPRVKKRARQRKRTKTDKPKPQDDDQNLFVLDSQPAEVPSHLALKAPIVESKESTLLLPEHVIVLDENVEILRPPTPEKMDDDFEVEYLSFADDSTRGMPRYFAPEEDMKRTIVCKNCGAEGDHDTRSCTVKICMTCGARNEHYTSGCPVNKSCFACGLRGHLVSDCPNKYSRNPAKFGDTCHRCDSRLHISQECPLMWRQYSYKSFSERDETLKARAKLENAQFGQGGEAYIARDEFCYQCGEAGHWGDHCSQSGKRKYPEPSAFSNEHILSGPFAETQLDRPKASRPATRSAYNDTREYSVGKAAKKKSMAANRDHAQRQSDRIDEDDWFARQETRGKASSSKPRERKPEVRKPEIHIKGVSRRDRDEELLQPSRMGYDGRQATGRYDGDSDDDMSGRHNRSRRSRQNNRDKRGRGRDEEDDWDLHIRVDDLPQPYEDSRAREKRGGYQKPSSKPPRNPPRSSGGAPRSRGNGPAAASGSGTANRPRYKGGYTRD